MDFGPRDAEVREVMDKWLMLFGKSVINTKDDDAKAPQNQASA